MKQITILLSSALTLLLFTGNNVSYASPHIRDFGPSKFKANKTNINTFKGQVRKGNVRKGNRFVPDGRNDGKVTLKRKALPNRNSGGRLHNNGAFLPWHRGVNKFHGNSSGDPLPIRVGKEKNALIPNPVVTLIPNPTVTLKGMVQMPQESQIGETGKNRVHMDLENEEVFPKVELGPDVVTTFDQKTNQVWTNGNATSKRNGVSVLTGNGDGTFNLVPPGIWSTGGAHGVQQPKGVPSNNTFAPQPMPGDYTLKSPNPL